MGAYEGRAEELLVQAGLAEDLSLAAGGVCVFVSVRVEMAEGVSEPAEVSTEKVQGSNARGGSGGRRERTTRRAGCV